MSRVVLPREPAGTPVSTVLGWYTRNPCAPLSKRRWDVTLTCTHEVKNLRRQPFVGDRRACRTCAALRTPRAYREVVRLAAMNLTEREVEYLAGRLAEQRDRQDGRR